MPSPFLVQRLIIPEDLPAKVSPDFHYSGCMQNRALPNQVLC
jgi:hypothetical protein